MNRRAFLISSSTAALSAMLHREAAPLPPATIQGGSFRTLESASPDDSVHYWESDLQGVDYQTYFDTYFEIDYETIQRTPTTVECSLKLRFRDDTPQHVRDRHPWVNDPPKIEVKSINVDPS